MRTCYPPIERRSLVLSSWVWVDPVTALTTERGRSETVPVLSVALNWPGNFLSLPRKKCHSAEITMSWEAWAVVESPWRIRLRKEPERGHGALKRQACKWRNSLQSWSHSPKDQRKQRGLAMNRPGESFQNSWLIELWVKQNGFRWLCFSVICRQQ